MHARRFPPPSSGGSSACVRVGGPFSARGIRTGSSQARRSVLQTVERHSGVDPPEVRVLTVKSENETTYIMVSVEGPSTG